MRALTETWSPKWCANVVGRYSRRDVDPATNEPLEQHWSAECTACGEKFGPVRCDSGKVQQHVARFAAMHVHKGAP